MNKIIVINGKGGIGKDTLIEALADANPHYIHVTNVSSITPITEACEKSGVLIGDRKDNVYRKLLSAMKTAIDAYYTESTGMAFTTKYLIGKVDQWKQLCLFGKATHHVLFVHIREPEMIQDFLTSNPDAKTLLISSDRAQEYYGNPSDEGVNAWGYNYIFEANSTKEEEAQKFCSFIENILKEEK